MEKRSNRKAGRRYNAEFKARTLELMRTSDKPLAQLGRDLGMPACTLKWWRDHERVGEMSEIASVPKSKDRVAELEATVRKLEKENKQLLVERDILKRAATWFAKESE